MSWPIVETQYLYERTSTTLRIPLTNEDGVPLESTDLTTLTATMTSLDTGLPIASMQQRDVRNALQAGVLQLPVTATDLARVTGRTIERRVIALSATYGADGEWHVEIPVDVRDVIGVGT